MSAERTPQAPRIGVALGSGAARGLAHIPYIEAMDELGVRPALIAGTSIGALIGAGWASGMSGRQLREHATLVLGTVQVIAGRLWTNRPSFRGMLQTGVSIQVDALQITNAFLPDAFADDFSALPTPFRAVATDLDRWAPTIFASGPLRPAIAASLAIPALFKPMIFQDRVYIDGGVTDPLPLDQAASGVDILIGIDVTGGPDGSSSARDSNMIDVGIAAARIITRTVVNYAMERYPPDVYVQAPVNAFGMLEFWRVREIMAAAEADKDRFKRAVADRIERALGAGG